MRSASCVRELGYTDENLTIILVIGLLDCSNLIFMN